MHALKQTYTALECYVRKLSYTTSQVMCLCDIGTVEHGVLGAQRVPPTGFEGSNLVCMPSKNTIGFKQHSTQLLELRQENDNYSKRHTGHDV
jgi:hypothetical protein